MPAEEPREHGLPPAQLHDDAAAGRTPAVSERAGAGSSGPRLPDARIRSRVSAYVYGDILVLSAVLALTPEHDLGWLSVLAIIATTLTTYLAHVLSDAIGERIGRTDAETTGHLRAELRDALPIAVAGLLPAAAIAAAALHAIASELAQGIAVAVVVIRLAAVGAVTTRLTGRAAPLSTVLSGVAIAAVGAVIAVTKAAVAH